MNSSGCSRRLQLARLAAALVSLSSMMWEAGAAEIAAGWTHSVAVKDGRVWTWGDNAHGQLGQPDAGRALRARPVEGVRDVVAVAASWHTLALTSDGRVYAWGRNNSGQIGNGRCGPGARESSPVLVAGLSGITAIAAGWDHSLALSREGVVYAWGNRSHGQLGDGARETGRPALAPVPVRGLSGVRAIAAGGQHSLALCGDGTVAAWGSNWNGQLGNGRLGGGTHADRPRPVVGPGGRGLLTGVISIAAGGLHSVAVTGDGRVYAWGYNGTGQIPSGERGGFWEDRGKRDVPAPTLAVAVGKKGEEALGGALAVAAGYESSYAVVAGGGVVSAGWSMYGELGSGASGGNRDALGPVSTGARVTWAKPLAGEWRPALVYRYTDRGHAAEGVRDVEVVDAFQGPALEIGESGRVGGATARISRSADSIEAQANVLYPARATVGGAVEFRFTRLMFGAHDGDDDFATDIRLRLTEARSGTVVDLPLSSGGRAGARVLPALGEIAVVVAGMHHALARDRAGAIWAWGHNGFGQLGDGSVADGMVAGRLAPFDGTTPPLPPAASPAREPASGRPLAPPVAGAIDVRARGARGDGIALDQPALQRAIDACAGGGVVWVPPGTYLTGTLELRDGVRLHLDAGATLLASANRDHFPESALVRARDVRGASVTGRGVIDGQGHFVGARGWRHNCILMENCRDILVEGVSTLNSGAWTQHYIRCVGLTIRGVTARSLRPGRNNDGIDLSGCERVRIERCTVISDDDAIVIKSQHVDRVNRDISAIDNVCHTYRGAFKLGTETRGRCERITCRGLTSHGAKAVELYSVDGSEVEGITVENVRARDALVALNIRLGARLRASYWAKDLEPKIGFLRGIKIRDLDVEIGDRPWREILLEHEIPDAEWATAQPERPYDSCISGLPGHPVEDVTVDGMRVRVPGGVAVVPAAETLPERPEAYPHAGNFGVLPAHGLFVRHARDVSVRRATFATAHPDARPPIASHDAPGLTVE